MSSEKKYRIPKFTMGSLLTIMAALAVGLAVSQSPAPSLEVWEADMRWQLGLMCGGGVLLVYELIRQALLIVRQCRLAESEIRIALVIALSQRLVFALLVSGLLTMRLLLSRRVITEIQRIEYPNVYIEFWPNLILTITILVATRMMLIRRAHHRMSLTKVLVASSVIFVGLAGIAIFMFSDRAENIVLTHFATDAVEKNSPIDMQRTGFFPNHLAEGFRSFWLSATAALGIVLAAGLLWLHATAKQQLVQLVANATFFFFDFVRGSVRVVVFFPGVSTHQSRIS